MRRLGVGEVGLGDRHDAALDTPSARSTAACSRVWGITPSSAATVIRYRSIPVAPATIVRTKRSWPGTSITDSRRPEGSVRLRVAELDRDPARALLGQPVGVDAGQRPDQRGLAVVDVAGGAERQRRRRSSERWRARRRPPREPRRRSACADRAARVRRGSARSPAGRRRAARRRSPSGSAGLSATAGPSSSSSGSAPPPTLAVARITSASRADLRRASRRRAARSARSARVEHRQHGDLAPGPCRVAVQSSVASSAASDSLSIRSARASGCARAAATASCAPDEQAGLGPAEQLVARAADERRAGRDRAPQRRLVRQRRRSRWRRPARPSRRRRSPARRARTAPRSRPPRRTRACGSSTGGRAGSRRPGPAPASARS